MGVIHTFNHPLVAALLLTLAFLGLAIEVRSEGFRRAGWAGLLALGLFLASHLASGTPAWTALPVLAGVLAIWPALRDPRRRLSAAAGTLLLAAGAYTVMVGPGAGQLDHARAGAVLLAATSLVAVVGLLVWMRLPATLRPERRAEVFFFDPDAGEGRGVEGDAARVDLVGARGTALSPLRPGGVALVRGERLEVVTEGEWLEEGCPLEVVETRGVHPRVRPLAP